jgi:Tfp pilus assembly protein PilP
MLAGDGRGPLEHFDVTQLSVVGVVWKNNNARALVQDPSGMTYIVAEGARIGKNEGRVTQIADNLVVVKETYVDTVGEETTKDIEMRIRVTEGG